MDNFSREKWMERCRIFERNRKGLGFRVKFQIGEDNKGKIWYSQELEEKYKSAVSALVFEIIRGSFIIFRDIALPSTYAREEDRKAQNALHVAEYNTQNVETYIQILLDEGIEKAMDVFAAKQALIRFSYEAAHMVYTNGRWTAPDGSLYQQGAFIDQRTGQAQYSYYSSVWDLLLTDEADEEVSVKAGKA